jgi:hypothetical protein
MPAQAALTLKNYAGTTEAFSPDGTEVSPTGVRVSSWVNAGTGYRVGRYYVTLQHSLPNKNGLEKYRFIFQRAVMETLSNNTQSGINPIPTKGYDVTAILEMWAPARATGSDLNDLIANVKEALNTPNDAMFFNILVGRGRVY